VANSAARSDESDADLDPGDLRLIRLRVQKAIRTWKWLDDQDLQEDLEHDAVIHWLRARHRYSPARGNRDAYLRKVVDHCITDSIRAQVRQRGGSTPPLSLNVDRALFGDRSLEDNRASPYKLEAHALRELFEGELIEQLTPQELRIFRRLLDDRSVAEIAREFGLHRDTVNEARRRIRRYGKQLDAD